MYTYFNLAILKGTDKLTNEQIAQWAEVLTGVPVCKLNLGMHDSNYRLVEFGNNTIYLQHRRKVSKRDISRQFKSVKRARSYYHSEIVGIDKSDLNQLELARKACELIIGRSVDFDKSGKLWNHPTDPWFIQNPDTEDWIKLSTVKFGYEIEEVTFREFEEV